MTEAWIGGGVALATALALASLWRLRGWGDAPTGPAGARKLQVAAVPAVGGLAIAVGWGVMALCRGGDGDFGLAPLLTRAPSRWWLEGSTAPSLPQLGVGWIALALLVGLAAGVWDDLRRGGLPPRVQLAGQLLVGVLASFYFHPAQSVVIELGGGGEALRTLTLPGTWTWAAVAACLALAVLNGINTFDNADGAVCGVAGMGLLAAASPLAPAVLLFLVPNLLLRRPASGRSGARDPWAYLGDGGSQLVGVAVLVTPAAWPALLLPLLDLGRLCLARPLAGQAPWVGDRRHLAHRLQRRGLGPLAVAGVLVAIAAPFVLWPSPSGAAGTTALFALACRATRGFEGP